MTGDSSDIAQRVYSTFPKRWIGDSNPILDALVQGFASALAFVYSLYQFTQTQMRFLTASGVWLDLFVADFFGTRIVRMQNESDQSLRARAQALLFRERGTRASVVAAVQRATGQTPVLVELNRPADTLAYGLPQFGYGATGFYGSRVLHHVALCSVTTSASPPDVYSALEDARMCGTAIYARVASSS